jgi:hypothetical protein
MKRSQQALDALLAAGQALDGSDQAKAREARDQAEAGLRPRYDTPPLAALLNEIEEAIASAREGRPETRPMDLAPLAG